jgi:hypothetical protein
MRDARVGGHGLVYHNANLYNVNAYEHTKPSVIPCQYSVLSFLALNERRLTLLQLYEHAQAQMHDRARSRSRYYVVKLPTVAGFCGESFGE